MAKTAAAVQQYWADQLELMRTLPAEVHSRQPESIHDLRAASRRLKATVRLYQPLLRPRLANNLIELLDWYNAQLGQARDAEVIAEEVAETAIKLQEAGNGPTLQLLSSYMNMLADCDIFDQVRAKLHKAVGRAALAEGLKQQAAEHYRRAIELHDKVGIKKELEVLERELKKEQQPDAQGGGS